MFITTLGGNRGPRPLHDQVHGQGQAGGLWLTLVNNSGCYNEVLPGGANGFIRGSFANCNGDTRDILEAVGFWYKPYNGEKGASGSARNTHTCSAIPGEASAAYPTRWTTWSSLPSATTCRKQLGWPARARPPEIFPPRPHRIAEHELAQIKPTPQRANCWLPLRTVLTTSRIESITS